MTEKLHVSPFTVYKWIREGKITTEKVNGKARIPMFRMPIVLQTPRGGRWM